MEKVGKGSGFHHANSLSRVRPNTLIWRQSILKYNAKTTLTNYTITNILVNILTITISCTLYDLILCKFTH